ncbi:WD repeat-containing protein 78 [Merluccius polli]|uniref:Dynein axonemal intermediate chain 4 n=1 Tax=Merluccius polli TaxID=89951 RepID=A0AA47N3I6_MERPO|nr:WD repeat-containing protein 78 [Merluccius polli]
MSVSTTTLRKRRPSLKVTSLNDSKASDKGSLPTPRQTFKVFDDSGADVTPKPLYQPDPGSVQTKHSKILANDASAVASTDFLSTLFQSTTNTSFSGPFNRSFFGSSTVSRSSQSTMESINEDIEDPSSKRDIPITRLDIHVKREDVKEQLTEDMLEDVVDCFISETDTITLLEMPDVSVSVDAEDAESVRERNLIYAELCKNRMGNDKYMDRSMQTFNGVPKTKKIQTDRINMVDAATMATAWDMYDSFCGAEQGEAPLAADPRGDKLGFPEGVAVAPGEPEKNTSLVNTDSLASTTSSGMETEIFLVRVEDEPDPALILNSESFHHSLLVMERTVLANIYQPRLAAYRQLPALAPQDRDEGVAKPKTEVPSGVRREESSPPPVLELLWAFSCELTTGHEVSCMAWNKKNQDLLAVGYGHSKDHTAGLVCCWSLKNITWPERIFLCQSGVSALDFSASKPNLLAVGLQDGCIALHNIQSPEKSPGRSEYVHKHVWPLQQLCWTEQERGFSREETVEALISVSGDGRVSKWFQHKKLDCTDLMKLKRMHVERKRAGEKERKPEALISKLTPGLCFDFHPQESNIYLVGTEEGHIHTCSCSNNEQYLETYQAHKHPVHRVRWSPLSSDVFISCSSDWTVRLWRRGFHTPMLDLTSTYSGVYDVAWSPRWATVFAAVKQGQIEVWDLGSSILDPLIVYAAHPGSELTSVLFATNTDGLLVGDSTGRVTVYQLLNISMGAGNQVNYPTAQYGGQEASVYIHMAHIHFM